MPQSTRTRLQGVIPPMITPLTSDRQVDIPALERLVEHMIQGGVTGIFVLGTSGEGPWLPVDHKRQVIRATIESVAGRVPVLVGALEPSTARTLAAIDLAVNESPDGVVITTPYYFGVDDHALEQHIREIADHSPLPVILYNIPSMTHNPLRPDVVRAVLDHDVVVGIKDSAGDKEAFSQLLKLKDERPDFAVFQGAESLSLESLIRGADGVVPGMGNLAPNIFAGIFRAVAENNQQEAKLLQASVDQLWTLHGYAYWLVCLKYAASLLGFGSGETIGHGHLVDDHSKNAIHQLLEAANGAVG